MFQDNLPWAILGVIVFLLFLFWPRIHAAYMIYVVGAIPLYEENENQFPDNYVPTDNEVQGKLLRLTMQTGKMYTANRQEDGTVKFESFDMEGDE